MKKQRFHQTLNCTHHSALDKQIEFFFIERGGRGCREGKIISDDYFLVFVHVERDLPRIIFN